MKSRRSVANRAFLMSFTHPVFSIAWAILALYCIASHHNGWWYVAIVCLAIAGTQMFIRAKLLKELQ